MRFRWKKVVLLSVDIYLIRKIIHFTSQVVTRDAQTSNRSFDKTENIYCCRRAAVWIQDGRPAATAAFRAIEEASVSAGYHILLIYIKIRCLVFVIHNLLLNLRSYYSSQPIIEIPYNHINRRQKDKININLINI